MSVGRDNALKNYLDSNDAYSAGFEAGREFGRKDIFIALGKAINARRTKHLIPYGSDCDWYECFFCGEDEDQHPPHKPDCLWVRVSAYLREKGLA